MRPLLPVLLFGLLLTACTSDTPPTPQARATSTDFAPLTTGSYWVYQVRFTNLVTGTSYSEHSLDSVWVAGQQTLHGHTYAEIKSRSSCDCFSGLYRDSVGYLVNAHGAIQLAPTDRGRYLDTIYFLRPTDSSYYARLQTTPQDTLITVPALTALSRDWRGTRSVTPTCPTTATYRYTHAFHAPKVGLIKKTCYYCTDTRLDWELLRFRIAQVP